MSNDTNTRLLETAVEVIDSGYMNKYDLNTIEIALETNDLEMVHELVEKYWGEIYG